ncbi:MAG TPA: hypothetical protein VF275_05450 [Gammaproteobacteria bacterium]
MSNASEYFAPPPLPDNSKYIAEFKRERGREPGQFFHACSEWDFMMIDERCPEFEVCACNLDAMKEKQK